MNDAATTEVYTRFEQASGQASWELVPSFPVEIPRSEDLWGNAAYHPIEFDENSDMLHWVQLDEEAYRATPFLDRRALGYTRALHSFKLPIAPVPPLTTKELPIHWLFHVGHCGSTALSRLIGHHPDVLSLREPGFLWGYHRRSVSGALRDEDQELALRLCQRELAKKEAVVVKPSSIQIELCLKLFDKQPRSNPFIILSSTLENYLLNALKGEPRQPILNDYLAGAREAQRIWKSWGINLPEARPDGVPELLYFASLSWLGVISILGRWVKESSRNPLCLWLDHDDLLNNPKEVGLRVVNHLHLSEQSWESHAPMSVEKLGKSNEPFDIERYQLDRTTRREQFQRELKATFKWLREALISFPELRTHLQSSPIQLPNQLFEGAK